MCRMNIYPAQARSEAPVSLLTIDCLFYSGATWIFLRCLPNLIFKIQSSQTRTRLVMKKRQQIFRTSNKKAKSQARLNQNLSAFSYPSPGTLY